MKSCSSTTQRLLGIVGHLDDCFAEAEKCLSSMSSLEREEALIEALNRGSVRQCVDAIRLLEKLPEPGAISALLALQKHEHLWVRMAAAKTLGSMFHRAAVSGLIDWLKVEQNELVQSWIVMSLGNLGDGDALPHLIAALHQTQSPSVRYSIIRGLGNLGNPQAIPAIRKYANDPDQHVRNDVAEALKKLRKEARD